MVAKIERAEDEKATFAALVARGLSQRQIGVELGLSQTAVRTRLHRNDLTTSRTGASPAPARQRRAEFDPTPRVLTAGPPPFEGGMDHPVAKGDRSENAMVHLLRLAGFGVLIPTGVARYDFAIDDGTKIHRVQCKTGRLRNGVVQFSGQSTNPHSGKRMRYTGQVEYFAVWCEELSAGYLVPIELVGSVTALYVDAGASRQTARVNFAEWYQVHPRP